jgi:plasmid maintenance system antidote protein VapI
VISERTVKLYEQYPPEPRQGETPPTLAELLHEVEVAAKFGISRDELARQLAVHPELFESLVKDADVALA